jgi:hypothetical protein
VKIMNTPMTTAKAFSIFLGSLFVFLPQLALNVMYIFYHKCQVYF